MSLEHDPARSELDNAAGTDGSPRGPPDTKPLTMSVPEAGRVFLGVGRDASYQAAKRGQIPVIWVGHRMRVPVAAMERLLERAGEEVE